MMKTQVHVTSQTQYMYKAWNEEVKSKFSYQTKVSL